MGSKLTQCKTKHGQFAPWCCFLVANDRIRLNLEGHRFRAFLERVELLPINMNVARTSTQLDFKSDPADELIAATSIVYGIPLVTRDRTIRQSKLAPLAT